MSKTIDEKVVEMRFDNKQFESNIQTSLSSIDKLKNSLNFSGVAKSFENVTSSARKCDVSPLGNAVESIRLKFSALEVMAVTALANITNSAVNAGKRIVSALTIDPIRSGFQEYETQIGAIQTILANTQSKGTTLYQVNNALDELNKYADQTIYNFTEMTRNIGTFTAAGVELDTAVSSIKGIANLAAVSGSTSQQASTAMYQLSQAIAAGKVQLMDWNSVVNAGMGGELFQNALKRTATHFGYNVDAMIEKYGSFRESLTQGGWLTTEVLTETLTQLSGAYTEADLIAQGYSESQAKEIVELSKTAVDAATKVKTYTQLVDTLKESVQSGWTQSWEIIIGDFEQAKELFTEISETLGEMINASAEARNAVLSEGLSSGWDQFLSKGIENEADYIEMVKDVAKEHGIAIDEMIEKSGSFEKSLRDGWMTSDLLSESVDKYADKLRNMSDAELEAAGYTREQVASIEALRTEIQNGNISLDEFASKMSQVSGREKLIQSLKNAFEGLMSIITPVKEAFSEIFSMNGQELYDLTGAIENLTSKFKISETTANNLKRTFKGVFALFDIGFQGIKALVGGIADLIGWFAPAREGMLNFTGDIGDFIVSIDEAIKSSDAFSKAIGKIVDFIKSVLNVVKTFASSVSEAFKSFANIDTSPVDDFASNVESRFEPLTKIGELLGKAFNGIITVLEKISPILAKLGSFIGQVFGQISDAISTALDTASFDPILDLLNGGIFAAILLGIRKFIKSLTSITENGGGILGSIKDILDGVKGSLEAWQSSIKAGTLLKIAGAMAILTAAIIALTLVDSNKLTASLGAMSVLFVELIGSLTIFEKVVNGPGFKGIGKITAAMLGLSISILILSAAVNNLADLEWSELLKGLTGVAALSATMVIAMSALSKSTKRLSKGAAGLVLFAAAIRVLVESVEVLGQLDTNSLIKGLVGVGVLCTELAVFLKVTDLDGMGLLKGTGLVLLASSINVLATAVERFAILDTKGLVQGLVAVGAVLAELAVFIKLTGNAKHVVSTAAGMTILGAAMLVFESAIEKMGRLSWEEIGKGLTTIAGALTAVTIAMNLMPKGMITKATGLVIVASSLLIIGNAVQNMGSMSWENIAKGLVTLAGSMTVLAVALKAMKKSVSGAASMLIISSALAIFTPVIKALGNMSWEEIARGLVTLAGAFTVIGVAGAVLGSLTPAIIGLSAAIALLGVGCLAAGAGVLAFSAGLSALAVSGTAGAAALVAVITSVVSLIPVIFKEIGEGVIAFAEVIGDSGPILIEAFTTLFSSAINALVKITPELVDGLFFILDNVLSALVEHTPVIVEQLFDILIGVINALSAKVPELVKAAIGLLMSFFEGVIDALKGIDVEVLAKGLAGIGVLSAIMVALKAVAKLVPGAMKGLLGIGVVIAELGLILAALGALAQIPGLQWLVSEGGNFLEAVGTALGQFVGGIVGGFMQGVSSSFPQIALDLSAFMVNIQPFIDGASKINPSMMEGVQALASTILVLAAGNILDAIASWLAGGSSMSEFAAELVPFGRAMNEFAGTVSGIDGDVVKNAAIAGKTLAEMAATLPNSGGVFGFFAGENDMDQFASQLIPFGNAMMDFSKSVDGLKANVVTNAANAGKALAEMAAAMPNSGGLAGIFAGNNDIDDFAEKLVPFGTAMKEFGDAVYGLKPATVVNAANAGKALAEMSSTFPKEGGLFSIFTGGTDMEAFGDELVPFGQSMKEFSVAVDGLKVDTIQSAANAGKALAEMGGAIPTTGGLFDVFSGSKDMTVFGEQLVPFGKAMKDFSIIVTGLGTDVINNAITIGNAIVELANKVPSSGGLFDFFTGRDDLGTFGENLKAFGTCFAEFSKSAEQIKPEVVTSSITAANGLLSLQSAINESGGGDIFSNDSIGAFGLSLLPLGEGLGAFYNGVSGIDATKLSGTITQLNRLIPVLKDVSSMNSSGISSFGQSLTTLGESGIDAFTSAFYNSYSKTSQAITYMLNSITLTVNGMKGSISVSFTSLMNSIITSIEIKKTSFRTTAVRLMTEFKSGITSNKTSIKSAVTSIISSLTSSIRSEYYDFYNAGVYLVQGFGNGISSYTWYSNARSRAMANQAYTSAMNALNAHSPSKLFEEVGTFVPLGFANGIAKKINDVKNSTEDMTGNAVLTASTAMSQISSILSSDIDSQPTIRPVLDLSEIQNGRNRLYSMVNGMDGYGISGTVSYAYAAASSSKRPSSEVERESKIVDKLQTLINELSDMPGMTNNTFNISGDNPKEIANEVSKILQRQIDRRKSTWA